jgi:hypothetical protein
MGIILGTLLYFFKFVSEDIIEPIFIYSDHAGNTALVSSLRPFMGSQEIVTGLIDFLTAMLLLYLYYVMGSIDMIPAVENRRGSGLSENLQEEGF